MVTGRIWSEALLGGEGGTELSLIPVNLGSFIPYP